MNVALRPAPQPWKAALLALFFIVLLGFTAAIALRHSPSAATRCRCHDMSPANRCFCPKIGSACQCER